MTRPKAIFRGGVLAGVFALSTGCGSGEGAGEPAEAGVLDVGAPIDLHPTDAGAESGDVDAGRDATAVPILPADRFVVSVVSFTPGRCGGFGTDQLPNVVMGPPKGGGPTQGSLDVLSLGTGGAIVVGFGDDAIVDGPGPDFLVFENAFAAGGDPTRVFAEPAEVAVSEDGTTWATWPCTATSYPYGACAGWHATLSSPGNRISPVDATRAGGDPFDLADVGVARARFVRIRDVGTASCPDAGDGPTTNGFDFDALAIVNAALF